MFFKKKIIFDQQFAEYAEHLYQLLFDAAKVNKAAGAALEDLRPYIEKAISGKLKIPVKRIPRRYDFVEGELKGIPGLESAYAKFSLKAEGYDMEGANKFMDQIDKEIEEENKPRSLSEVIEDIRSEIIPADYVYHPFMQSELYVLVQVLDDMGEDKVTTDNFRFHLTTIGDMAMVVVSESIDLLDGYNEKAKAVHMTGESLIDLLKDELGVSILLSSGGAFNLPPNLINALKVQH